MSHVNKLKIITRTFNILLNILCRKKGIVTRDRSIRREETQRRE